MALVLTPKATTVKLYLVIRRYQTIGGATVEIRRTLFRRFLACTGCRHYQAAGDLDTAANQHASTCRALPA